METVSIGQDQLDALGARLASMDEVLDDQEKVTLLAVFALAGEALDARVQEKADVAGFIAGPPATVTLQGNLVGPPDLLAGFKASVGGGPAVLRQGGANSAHLNYKLSDVLVSG